MYLIRNIFDIDIINYVIGIYYGYNFVLIPLVENDDKTQHNYICYDSTLYTNEILSKMYI